MIPYEELAAALERHQAGGGAAPMPPVPHATTITQLPPPLAAIDDNTLTGHGVDEADELDNVPFDEDLV